MKKTILMGKGFEIDLPKLMETRLLVAANSGGGKSWTLRRLLEQTNGEIQQIVIDLEGEFYTLREQYDNYLLIGKGGDIKADTRAAAMLATKLLELGASAIIDLSELKFHERKHFVRLFLESLIEAPEELRHPVMVVLDEAHHFAPQVGESEATGAVIDLMTRGRKRKLCGVLATQRVSKLHKDAIAECNNKMFGRTAQDIDVKRTSDELGFASSSREAFETLRNLKAGEFFAFGTAIGSNVERYTVGEVKTLHQQTGKRGKERKVVPPKTAVKEIIAKLADLPQEAEKKVKTETELRKELAVSRAEVTRLQTHGSATTNQKQLEEAVKTALYKRDKEWEKVIGYWKKYASRVYLALQALLRGIQDAQAYDPKEIADSPEAARGVGPVEIERPQITRPKPAIRYVDDSSDRPATTDRTTEASVEGVAVTGKTLEVLKAVVSFYPASARRSQVATIAIVKQRTSTLRNAISKLRMAGLLDVSGDTLIATPEGVAYLGDQPMPSTPEEKIERWRGVFSGSTLEMFDRLLELQGEWISREELAGMLNMDLNVSTFRNCVSKLNATGVIETSGVNIRASEDLLS